MALAAQPFTFVGSLQLSADPTLPPDPIPFNFSGQFTALQASTFEFTGSGTEAVPFGTIPAAGAKGLLISYPTGQTGAAAILVTIDAGTEPLEVTPGGMLLFFSPNPSAGITACSIAYTAGCQVRVWILGYSFGGALDWNDVLQHGLTALGSGGSAFLGAFLRFKRRLRECEELLKHTAGTISTLQADIDFCKNALSALRADFEREVAHRKELAEFRKEERDSRHDPLNDLRGDITEMKVAVEKLKDRGARYVHTDTFTAFTKQQEDQWKVLERTLGRIEGSLK